MYHVTIKSSQKHPYNAFLKLKTNSILILRHQNVGVLLEKGVYTSGHLSVIVSSELPVYTVFENHTTRVLGSRMGGDLVVLPGHLFMMVI